MGEPALKLEPIQNSESATTSSPARLLHLFERTVAWSWADEPFWHPLRVQEIEGRTLVTFQYPAREAWAALLGPTGARFMAFLGFVFGQAEGRAEVCLIGQTAATAHVFRPHLPDFEGPDGIHWQHLDGHVVRDEGNYDRFLAFLHQEDERDSAFAEGALGEPAEERKQLSTDGAAEKDGDSLEGPDSAMIYPARVWCVTALGFLMFVASIAFAALIFAVRPVEAGWAAVPAFGMAVAALTLHEASQRAERFSGRRNHS